MVLLVSSINARSVLTRNRWKKVEPVFKQEQMDVICVQECRIPRGLRGDGAILVVRSKR